jgi:hypothetical protein
VKAAGLDGEAGQGTIEWVALVCLVAALLAGVLAAAGGGLPGVGLARTVAARLLCAADLSQTCSTDGELVAAYGPELAARIADNAPEIVYEAGMTALPVDFRSCRGKVCGNGPDSGPVWTSDSGEPAAAFVHAVDCRTIAAQARSADDGYDCSGERAGNLYLQYWLYYEDSTWLGGLKPGGLEHHEDDWEGYQVRIGTDGTESRATSHHGYNYDGGPGSWLSDAGIAHRSAWGPTTGRLYVSGGSHAGHVHEPGRVSARRLKRAAVGVSVDTYAAVRGSPARARVPRRLTIPTPPPRWTPASHLTLIPIETLDDDALRTSFAIVPPWFKDVYTHPESTGT